MSDSNRNGRTARISPFFEDQTSKNGEYFENSAADFMDILTTGVEEFQDQLKTSVPTSLVNLQFSSFHSTLQDGGPQSSFNSAQNPAQSNWKDSAEKANNLTDPKNTVNPQLLSYSAPTYSPSPNNYISSNTEELYSGSYYQTPRQCSPTTLPQNSSLYSSLISSSMMQGESPSTAPWTSFETQTLQHLHSLGQSYASISQQIPGRSEASCRQRYSRITRKGSSHKDDGDAGDRGDSSIGGRVRWTAEEDEILAEMVARGDSFEEVAHVLKGRSARACRSRHYEYLGLWRSRKRGY